MTDLTLIRGAKNTRIHFIGIGGSGLSAIARLMLESGYSVSGSDRLLSPLAQDLAADGAQVFVGHAAENIQGADLVVRSSAVTDDNIEVTAARAAGIPVFKRDQFLGQITDELDVYAVAGTHGKTTTTAMLAWAMTALGFAPSYIIGGTAKNLGGKNAHYEDSPAFVIEADEYDRMFLGLRPSLIIITYLEHDHPDCFPTLQDYTAAFVDFVNRLKPGGTLLVSYDNAATLKLAESAPEESTVLTYGTSPLADYGAEDIHTNSMGGFSYTARWNRPDGSGGMRFPVDLQVPGMHNVRNSLAALAAIHSTFVKTTGTIIPNRAMVDFTTAAARALSEFSGTGRRFDILGEAGGITVINDYAHHPTEIQATLEAARARYPERRIWAVWQPHTFSRTRALMADFVRAFDSADQVIVTGIYAAREKAKDFNNFSADQVVAKMHHPAAQYLTTLEEVSQTVLNNLRPGDVLLVLSAGDADQVSTRVLDALKERKGLDA